MNLKTTFRAIMAISIMMLTACKKDFDKSFIDPKENEPLKVLNQKEKETVVKFEHASLVLQGVFSSYPSIRREFNGFITAKLAKSGTDEELTFKEIFDAKPIKLTGVKSDFLYRFRDAFVDVFIKGNYPNATK